MTFRSDFVQIKENCYLTTCLLKKTMERCTRLDNTGDMS